MNTALNSRRQNGRYPMALPAGLASVQGEFDRLFDRFFTGDETPAAGWLARLDLWEDENAYHLEFDAPGVDKESVEITVEKGVLKVAARREEVQEEGRKYWHRERRYGQAERHITLPESANEDSIEAELTGGVLHIKLEKKAEVQPKRITVKGD